MERKIPLVADGPHLKLKTCTGEHLEIKGQALVDVSYNWQNVKLPLQVIEGDGPALLWKELVKNTKIRIGNYKKGYD